MKTLYKVIGAVVVGLIIGGSLFFALFYFTAKTKGPSPPTPQIILKLESYNAETVINVTVSSPGRCPPESLHIEYFSAIIRNESKVQHLFEKKVTEILNDESSSVIFYDRDRDNTISIGDIFVIRGLLKDEADEFILLQEKYRVVFTVRL